ncbi:MAG: PAS domain-containing protein [Cyclobacteriaceae bacterium]|nr:PAS domain-containing protein [Cyclobacteriaceae bacterium]MCH8515150.1 PAS domain-containing protein [Cyclobacteriaceae bacterium]
MTESDRQLLIDLQRENRALMEALITKKHDFLILVSHPVGEKNAVVDLRLMPLSAQNDKNFNQLDRLDLSFLSEVFHRSQWGALLGSSFSKTLSFGHEKLSIDFHVFDQLYLHNAYEILLIGGRKINQDQAIKEDPSLIDFYFQYQKARGIMFETTINSPWTFHYVSSNVKEILGYEPQELTQKGVDFYSLMHPDDLAALRDWEITTRQVDNIAQYTYRIKKADGSYLWVNEINQKSQSRVDGQDVYSGYLFPSVDQKFSDNLLSEERNRTHHALEATGVGTFEIVVNKDQVIINHSLAKILFGKSLNANYHSLGIKEFRSFYHPSDLPFFDQQLYGVSITLSPYEMECRIKKATGGYINVLQKTIVHKRDGAGRALLLTGVTTDISMLVEHREQLYETKRLLHQTSQIAKIGGWVYHEANGELLWTDETKRIFGLNIDFQPSLDNIDDLILPKDQVLLHQCFEQAMEFGIPYDVELRARTAEGKMIWIRDVGRIVEDPITNKKSLFGTVQDISESKRLQAQLEKKELLLKANTEAVSFLLKGKTFSSSLFRSIRPMGDALEFDCIHICQWMPQKNSFKSTFEWVRQLSYSKKKDPRYQYFGDVKLFEVFNKLRPDQFLEPSKDLSLRESMSFLIEHQGSSFIFPLWVEADFFGLIIFDKQDSQISLDDTALSLIHSYCDSLTHALGRIQLESDLKEEKRKAQSANDAKSEFLAHMTHELRTPLAGIKGFTELLQQTTLDNLQKSYVDSLAQSSLSLLDLVNDTLDMAKIEAGKLDLNEQENDLHQLCNECITTLSYQANAKNIKLYLRLPASLPKTLVFDFLRLKQVLINLLSNAVKFTEQGYVQLAVLLDAQNHDQIIFEVQDTGVGIADDKLDQIFEAFAQEEINTSEKYGGTGLGLTISNYLLTLMNSALRVESKKAIGSKFFFTMKIKNPQYTINCLERIKKTRHVFLIDQDKKFLDNFCEMLDYPIEGHCFITFKDFIKYKTPQEDKAPLVLIDYESCKEDFPFIQSDLFRKFNQDVKTIAISNSKADKAMNESVGLFDGFLMKPFSSNEILQKLDQFEYSKREERRQINKQISVLVVDDNEVNAFLLESMLKKEVSQIEVKTCGSGKEALQILSKEALPSFIITDLQMPNLDGFDICRFVKSSPNYSQIPVVAWSAATDRKAVDAIEKAGFDAHISKPIDKSEFAELLTDFIENGDLKTHSTNIGQKDGVILFDLDTLVKTTGLQSESLNQVLYMLIKSIDELTESWSKARANRQMAKLMKVIHKLRGTCATAHLLALKECIDDYESYIKQENTRLLDSRENQLFEKMLSIAKSTQHYINGVIDVD